MIRDFLSGLLDVRAWVAGFGLGAIATPDANLYTLFVSFALVALLVWEIHRNV